MAGKSQADGAFDSTASQSGELSMCWQVGSQYNRIVLHLPLLCFEEHVCPHHVALTAIRATLHV